MKIQNGGLFGDLSNVGSFTAPGATRTKPSSPAYDLATEVGQEKQAAWYAAHGDVENAEKYTAKVKASKKEGRMAVADTKAAMSEVQKQAETTAASVPMIKKLAEAGHTEAAGALARGEMTTVQAEALLYGRNKSEDATRYQRNRQAVIDRETARKHEKTIRDATVLDAESLQDAIADAKRLGDHEMAKRLEENALRGIPVTNADLAKMKGEAVSVIEQKVDNRAEVKRTLEAYMPFWDSLKNNPAINKEQLGKLEDQLERMTLNDEVTKTEIDSYMTNINKTFSPTKSKTDRVRAPLTTTDYFDKDVKNLLPKGDIEDIFEKAAVDADGDTISYVSRSLPATVQWLMKGGRSKEEATQWVKEWLSNPANLAKPSSKKEERFWGSDTFPSASGEGLASALRRAAGAQANLEDANGGQQLPNDAWLNGVSDAPSQEKHTDEAKTKAMEKY